MIEAILACYCLALALLLVAEEVVVVVMVDTEATNMADSVADVDSWLTAVAVIDYTSYFDDSYNGDDHCCYNHQRSYFAFHDDKRIGAHAAAAAADVGSFDL